MISVIFAAVLAKAVSGPSSERVGMEPDFRTWPSSSKIPMSILVPPISIPITLIFYYP
jgi:hypothetical protein